jgi:hypothetical protein
MTTGADKQNQPLSNVGLADPGCYRILVKGCLDGSWSDWFDSLAVEADVRCGQTTITARLVDQAALHGLLHKVQDLGLVLLAVVLVQAGPCEER